MTQSNFNFIDDSIMSIAIIMRKLLCTFILLGGNDICALCVGPKHNTKERLSLSIQIKFGNALLASLDFLREWNWRRCPTSVLHKHNKRAYCHSRQAPLPQSARLLQHLNACEDIIPIPKFPSRCHYSFCVHIFHGWTHTFLTKLFAPFLGIPMFVFTPSPLILYI